MAEDSAALDRMVGAGLVERVPANPAHALVIIRQAELHLATAATVAVADPDAAFALQYDAARKSLTAVLIAEGVRVKAKGGHAGTYEAVRVGLSTEDRAVIRPFDRLRKRRYEVEYLTESVPQATTEEVLHAIEQSQAIVEWARTRISQFD